MGDIYPLVTQHSYGETAHLCHCGGPTTTAIEHRGHSYRVVSQFAGVVVIIIPITWKIFAFNN